MISNRWRRGSQHKGHRAEADSNSTPNNCGTSTRIRQCLFTAYWFVYLLFTWCVYLCVTVLSVFHVYVYCLANVYACTLHLRLRLLYVYTYTHAHVGPPGNEKIGRTWK